MPYIPIDLPATRDPGIQRIFQHASNYLADVYTMIKARPSAKSKGGRCNFSIALVLSCVLDGLATEIYPIAPTNGDDAQYQRLRILLELLPWGEKKHGWITRLEASKVLYTDIRNPLVHNLAADTKPRIRRDRFSDPAIISRMIDDTVMTADQLEKLHSWNDRWPVMWAIKNPLSGKQRIAVSTLAFYWSVKQLTIALSKDKSRLDAALQLRKKRRVQ